MMTRQEAEVEIKRLMTKFDDDKVNYQDFKTPREYMVFREVRRQRLLAEAAISDLAKERCLKCEIWKFAFGDYALAVGNKSPETYKLYRRLVKAGEIPPEVQLPLLLSIYLYYRVLSDFHKYLVSAYKKYPTKVVREN